jgi:pyocin large subunit-like protein
MERYVQKRLMASGHQVSEQEIVDYVKKVAEGLNDVHRE